MGNPLMWLLTGVVPLFTAFGIRVQAHASLILTIVLVLVFGLGQGSTWQDRVGSMSILFCIVLLHEFGHCFAARRVGGEADEIIMHPLGGLAMARSPHRPLPTFITVAGGPAVNVVICLLCGVILFLLIGWVPWNPARFKPVVTFSGWLDVAWYTGWVYQVSYWLLMFNLLPIYPLDGGQMLQAILWPKFGYYKSMNFSCITGMAGAVVGGMIALATGNLGLAILAIFGFTTCLNLRRQLLAAGPYAFQDDHSFASSLTYSEPKVKKPSRWAQRRARKAAEAERNEQAAIDAILAKVSAQGMQSLTNREKKILQNATERQRQADTARARRTR